MIASPEPTEKTHRFLRWHRRVLGICLGIFALELGLVLVFFPWVQSWDLSSIPLISPLLGRIWMNRYFRGALSGLGFLNIYIGVAETLKQVRQLFNRER